MGENYYDGMAREADEREQHDLNQHDALAAKDAEIAYLKESLARVTALLADARLVCGFVRGWWPGLEDGISWPQKDEDNEILRAAERVCGAKEIEG